MQLIETTGEGKSAVATPDGKSRKKKKKLISYENIVQTYFFNNLQLCTSVDELGDNLEIMKEQSRLHFRQYSF